MLKGQFFISSKFKCFTFQDSEQADFARSGKYKYYFLKFMLIQRAKIKTNKGYRVSIYI